MTKNFAVVQLAAMLFLASFTSTAWPQTTFPDNLELVYELQLAGMTLGTVEKRLHLIDGTYIADSRINPGMAAKLFFSGKISESSRFKVDSNGLQAIEFHAVRKGDKSYDRKATFDHAGNLVKYNNGETEALRKNTYDLGSFPFAFILEDLGKLNGKIFEINSGKDYDTWQVIETGSDPVSTPSGEYAATKITLKRVDKDNRFYFVWLDNTSQYPVKIIRQKNGKQTTMVLKSIRG